MDTVLTPLTSVAVVPVSPAVNVTVRFGIAGMFVVVAFSPSTLTAVNWNVAVPAGVAVPVGIWIFFQIPSVAGFASVPDVVGGGGAAITPLTLRERHITLATAHAMSFPPKALIFLNCFIIVFSLSL